MENDPENYGHLVDSKLGYHWNHNGESQFLNGTAMGRKMVGILAP